MQPIIVPGKLESLEKIGKFIMLAAEKAGLERSRAYKLRLAVDEIATNIINYGYLQSGVDGVITLNADIDEQALTITLDDTAEFFDPISKTPPTPDAFTQPLEERKNGGWGVYLAIQSVDKFNYQRFRDHNQNIFVMYRAAAG